MRLFFEIILVGALLFLGWEKSFKERLTGATPSAPQRTVIRRAGPVAPTPPDASWMWNPKRKTILDRPAYDPRERDPRYVDSEGRTYWIDGEGKRHYER